MSKTRSEAGSQDALVRRFRYRVNPITVRLGGVTTHGAIIESRAVGQRKWMVTSVRGVPLVYQSRSTAARHCAWLNDKLCREAGQKDAR